MKKIDSKTIKLIICDIDNTLVQKHQPLSDQAFKVINILKEKGVLFGLASGRAINQLQTLADSWNIDCDILIGMNGSEMYDGLTDEQKSYYRMEAEWLKECMDIMSPFDTKPHLIKDGKLYGRKDDTSVSASNKYLKNSLIPYIVENDAEFWKEPASKIGFRVKAEDMPMIEEYVAKYPSENYIGFKTENVMFEFCNIHASKGDLLEKFCTQHAIDLKDVWAFGDMTNDVSMLETAGVGVCMLNGSDDAKAASDLITEKSCHEDGWADFVINHILIPNGWME